ncbi:hypothetical protein NL529_30220, partial [Klebsiella pneumoniae]|nr:hypothetical protein [Klebsiella pneumoniae]
AKALEDRPALKIEITGRVDPDADREGLKRAAMNRSVRTQKMNDLLKAGSAPRSVDEVKVDPSEYPTDLTAAYKDASFPKPRNMIGMA